MLHLVCECQPLQTQHFFIFLFASLKKWLFVIIFVTLRYSYSMEHQLSQLLLVFLAGYFGFQVSARQLSAESGAERASKRRTNCGLVVVVCLVTAELFKVNKKHPISPTILTWWFSMFSLYYTHHCKCQFAKNKELSIPPIWGCWGPTRDSFFTHGQIKHPPFFEGWWYAGKIIHQIWAELAVCLNSYLWKG